MSNGTNDAAKQSVTDCNHLGNAAKMRDACANIAEYARSATCYTDNSHILGYLYQIEEWAESALADPPRNCDVGTSEEQVKRYFAFCDRHTCQSCPVKGTTDCGFLWEQMPYEEGGANGK